MQYHLVFFIHPLQQQTQGHHGSNGIPIGIDMAESRKSSCRLMKFKILLASFLCSGLQRNDPSF